jgi:hypothetical protein
MEINDRVMIRRHSQYYGISRSNPADVVGTIYDTRTHEDGNIIYFVRWDTGAHNDYFDLDLALFNPAPIVLIIEATVEAI